MLNNPAQRFLRQSPLGRGLALITRHCYPPSMRIRRLHPQRYGVNCFEDGHLCAFFALTPSDAHRYFGTKFAKILRRPHPVRGAVYQAGRQVPFCPDSLTSLPKPDIHLNGKKSGCERATQGLKACASRILSKPFVKVWTS